MPHLHWNHHDSLPKRALGERGRNRARLKEGKVDRDKVIEKKERKEQTKGKRKMDRGERRYEKFNLRPVSQPLTNRIFMVA